VAPYRYHVAAGVAGLAMGAVVGAVLDLEAFACAIIGGGLAQLVLNLWWWLRTRHRAIE